MGQLVGLPIDSAVLLLGDRAIDEFNQSEHSLSFGRLSLLGQTFFNMSGIIRIPSTSFYPQPRTDCAVIRLEPKSKKELTSNPADFIVSQLFMKERKHAPLINDLKQALVDLKTTPIGSSMSKREFHQKERSDTRRNLKHMAQTLDFGGHNSPEDERVGSQSQALRTIDKMGISNSILNKQFHSLDNQDIRELAQAIRGFYA
jgi:16S rRNA A1518/A1519 N6-dimethyltransferase RsmA/KsgA/DIM1 with predicted DNA glycosylase/AP lyase activity